MKLIKIDQLIKLITDRYYKLKCQNCNNDWYGTREQYNREMSNPDSEWTCGHCGNRESLAFDDIYFETQQEEFEKLQLMKNYEYRIRILEDKIQELKK